ncbi:hypothetical protein J0A68_08450 [Algoriphagus sp. H41]|uniref:Uncharacterized protein n=1 Tax=Algoriphagus oliviformis TaxID=2811231 RepID=A0ABS3C1I4_9BACT|nr:hypothetical protein [Algoriphagus oliviformis]MBN7810982.1 hypothetical protein [Algoriphagus oliviformis]
MPTAFPFVYGHIATELSCLRQSSTAGLKPRIFQIQIKIPLERSAGDYFCIFNPTNSWRDSRETPKSPRKISCEGQFGNGKANAFYTGQNPKTYLVDPETETALKIYAVETPQMQV